MKYQTTTTKHIRGTPIRIFGENHHFLHTELSETNHCVYNEACGIIFLFKYSLQQYILRIQINL